MNVVLLSPPKMKASTTSLAGFLLLFLCTFLVVAAPPNDDFANRIILSGATFAVDGTTVDATLEEGEPPTIYTHSSVWYEWTALFQGNLRVQIFMADDGISSYTRVHILSGNNLTQLQYVASCGVDSEANVNVDAGMTIQFRALVMWPWGYPVLFERPFTLCLESNSPPVNDHFANRLLLTNAVERIRFRNPLATLEPGETAAPSGGGNSVWYEWRAPASGIVHVLVDSSYNTWAGVYSGSTTPTVMITNSFTGSYCEQEVTFDAVSGQTYYLAFDTCGGYLPGNRAATLSLNGAARLELPKRRADGIFELRLYGERYRYYALEVSTNLATWSAISTNIYNYSLVFEDTNVISSAKFYRVRLVEP